MATLEQLDKMAEILKSGSCKNLRDVAGAMKMSTYTAFDIFNHGLRIGVWKVVVNDPADDGPEVDILRRRPSGYTGLGSIH